MLYLFRGECRFLLLQNLYFRFQAPYPATLANPGHTSLYARSLLAQLTHGGHRRLLFLAAMQAARQPAWYGFYQHCLDRGLSKIQALVALARKLARVAFAILKNNTTYVPRIACTET